MEKKRINCEECGKEQEYFDNPEEVMHTIFPNKKVCSNCFIKELKIAREQFIKDHPCPFKEIIYSHEETMGPFPRTTDMNRPETGCIIVWSGYGRYCVGEKNCPVYNGGIEKCNGK